MGEVYRARDLRLEREIALKVLPEGAAAEPTRLGRFVREAKAASALNHPNIVTVHEIGADAGTHYIAMELVQGRTIAELLAESQPLAVESALNYAVQLCEGLSRAHAAGIVHRDIKPSNVMVTRDGLVKVLDFGLAKLTMTDSADAAASSVTTATALSSSGILIGTPQYMSPEQILGEAGDSRSDVFSTGAVLYEMFTGHPPFDAARRGEIARGLLKGRPVPPRKLADVPEGLSEIVGVCLSSDPDARYADAGELLERLRSASSAASPPGTEKLTAAPFPAQHTILSWLRRWIPATGIVWVVMLATLLGLFAWRRGAVTGMSRGSAEPAQSAVLRKAKDLLRRTDLQENVDNAIDTLESARRQSPNDATLNATLAEAYVARYQTTADKQWLQRAFEAARKAVGINQDLAAGHVALGLTLWADGQNDAASKELERGAQLDPLSGAAWLALGRLRSTQGRTQEAESVLAKAIRFDAQNWAAWDALGTVHYRTQHYDAAIADWLKALGLTPDNQVVMIHLGAGYHMEGKFEEAASEFQRALELNDRNAATWNNLGTARYFQGQFEDAARAVERAVELAPGNYLYLGNLADCYRWSPRMKPKASAAYATAIKLADQKLTANPQDISIRTRVALYLAKSGQVNAALTQVEEVEKTGSNTADTSFRAAVVYTIADRPAQALAALKRAIQAGYSMHEIRNEPELAALRSNPAYAAVVPAQPPR
jgi:serine/threonine-protein kinase